MTDLKIQSFVKRQQELLELELKSDLQDGSTGRFSSDAETSRSRSLQGLDVFDVSVGLYGRTVVVLCCRDDDSKLLPSHKFTVGDEVEIRSKAASSGAPTGVVSQVTETSISIALFGKGKNTSDQEEDVSELDPPLSLLPKSSVEVHNKLVAALQELNTKGVCHPVAGDVVSSCFDQSSWTSAVMQQNSFDGPASLQLLNENLDHTQVDAIEFALASKGKQPIALIHGPPGTGKTTTIAELVYQAASVYKQRLLVTAPSNVAVDNILERLVAMQDKQQSGDGGNKKQRRNAKRKDSQQHRLKMVRLGHPARIKPSILPYSLESLVQASEGTEIVKDVRKELEHFLKVTQSTKASWNDKKAAYREIKSLRKEVRQREERVVAELVQTAQVILCTTVGAANRVLRDYEFDVVIIDEAAQALEASCWIPALKGKRLVLAGDHKQLPPTIQNTSIQMELGVTLFERIMDLYEKEESRVSRMLQVQYRMHQDIADWASQAMYQGRLQTFEGIKNQRLSHLPKVGNEEDQPTLLLMDTAGCGMDESVNVAGSRYNEGEAILVQNHVRTLVDMGLSQKEIAIISPYNGQVEVLKNLLLTDFPKLEIRSVDGFQGGEREAVILSLVRSNDSGGIGFLKDDRRLNVAITRAKRHVAVICDCETVSKSRFIQGLVDWMDEHGEHLSAMEFGDGLDEQDMADAERELAKIISSVSITPTEPQSTVESDCKPQRSSVARKQSEAAEAEAKRKGLMDEISLFAETAKPGEELKLSPELTSFDRRLVHEFATQLGIEHRSDGLDGVDRRITLSIPLFKVDQSVPSDDTPRPLEDDTAPQTRSQPSSFTALVESDDDEVDGDEDMDAPSTATNAPTPEASPPPMNSVLGDLAKERQKRAQAAQAADAKPPPQPNSGGKKKTGKKKKGQKLGGTKKAVPKDDSDKGLDDLDDMAFLDAQIDMVQNSHGRKVQGKGSYKTIVNGILLAKPPPREKPKNSQASSALNAKLKAAQEERRGKKGKKKR